MPVSLVPRRTLDEPPPTETLSYLLSLIGIPYIDRTF